MTLSEADMAQEKEIKEFLKAIQDYEVNKVRHMIAGGIDVNVADE